MSCWLTAPGSKIPWILSWSISWLAKMFKASPTNKNRYGASEHLCRTPHWTGNISILQLLMVTEASALWKKQCTIARYSKGTLLTPTPFAWIHSPLNSKIFCKIQSQSCQLQGYYQQPWLRLAHGVLLQRSVGGECIEIQGEALGNQCNDLCSSLTFGWGVSFASTEVAIKCGAKVTETGNVVHGVACII